MRKWTLGILAVLFAVANPALAADTPHHVLVSAASLQWGPAPPGLPPGSTLAVLDGNPAAEGNFTIRAKLPDGYRVLPHWHPTAEHLTVISGTLHVGSGDVFDESKAAALGAGDFAVMPAEMRHWVWSEGETILQIHGSGPFAIHYVNPADDPRQKTATE